MSYTEKTARVYTGWQLEKAFIYEKETLMEIRIRSAKKVPVIHEVYTGKVRSRLRELGAYFVAFDGHEGLLKTRKSLRVGEVLPLVVVKEPRDDKGYRVSDEPYYKGAGVIYFPEETRNRFSKKLPGDQVASLKETFKDRRGFLFRTRAETLSDETLREEMTRLAGAHQRALERAAIKDSDRLIHEAPQEHVLERLTDLNDILNLEEVLLDHLATTMVHPKGFRVHFEKTRLGHVIDFDSHQFRYDGPHPYLRINQEIFTWTLSEILLRRLQGVILVDLITMNDPWELGQFNGWVKQILSGTPAVKHHGISHLGILELTVRVEGGAIGDYSQAALLLERLYLRIAYLLEHTGATALKITLSGSYYPLAKDLEAIRRAFEVPLAFDFDNGVAEFKIQVAK